jgi:hypothetical protein
VPRKSRKRLVGRQEDVERVEREREYQRLEVVLHVEWQAAPRPETLETGSGAAAEVMCPATDDPGMVSEYPEASQNSD